MQPLSEEPIQSTVKPSEIGKKTFSTTRKGYDPSEVRRFLDSVSEALRDAQTREADMRTRLGKAVRRAEEVKSKTSTPSEEELTARLGIEVARVLESARTAAEERTARSLDEAEGVIKSAQVEADAMLAKAKTVLDERTAEAQAAATKIIDAADAASAELTAEADAVLERSQAAGIDHLRQAEVEGDGIVTQAEEARKQILKDMDRRRRSMRAQVERLKAARDRLLESHAVVQSNLDDATQELKHSLIEAKVKGESAARRAGEAPYSSHEDLETEVADSSLVGKIVLPEIKFRGSVPVEEAIGRPVDKKELKAPSASATVAQPVVRLPGAPDGGAADSANPAEPAWANDPKTQSAKANAGKAAIKETEEPVLSDLADEIIAELEAPEAAEIAAASKPAEPAKKAEAQPEAKKPEARKPDADKPETQTSEVPKSGVKDQAASAPATGGHPAGGPKTPPAEPVVRLSLVTAATPAISQTETATKSQVNPGGQDKDGEEFEIAAEAIYDASLDEELDDDFEDDLDDLDVTDDPPGGIDDLFARLRSNKVVDDQPTKPEAKKPEAKKPEAKKPEAKKPVQAAPEPSSIDASAVADIDIDTEAAIDQAVLEAAGNDSMVALRDSSVSDLEAEVAKRLKRVLADEQNVMLEATDREYPGALIEVLPDIEHHMDLYLDAIMPQLNAAHDVGATFIADGVDAPKTKRADYEAAMRNLVIGPIRERLNDVVPVDDVVAATSAVRGFYREHKREQLNSAASFLVLFAFSKGSVSVADQSVGVRWVFVDDGVGCPDGHDNQLAGPMPVGDVFPSGTQMPPIAPGCRCLLVPADR